MGGNRQKYLDQLKERLRKRQRRIDNGEDPDELSDGEPMEEENSAAASSGNILEDLDKRFESERDALLRKLRVSSSTKYRIFLASLVVFLLVFLVWISRKLAGEKWFFFSTTAVNGYNFITLTFFSGILI